MVSFCAIFHVYHVGRIDRSPCRPRQAGPLRRATGAFTTKTPRHQEGASRCLGVIVVSADAGASATAEPPDDRAARRRSVVRSPRSALARPADQTPRYERGAGNDRRFRWWVTLIANAEDVCPLRIASTEL